MRAPGGPGRKGTTYLDSGVDLQAGYRAIDLFKDHVRSTFRPEVVGDIGGFGGAFAFDPKRYKDPLLVSSTDGAGTKVMVAEAAGIYDTIGVDLVAMSVNDVAAHGAEPLFFLDYIVVEKVVPEIVSQLVEGVARGCREAGCALIGGEVAEHPGHMSEGAFDLAGFCVGVVDRASLLTGEGVQEGDILLGIASSGLHSNGFSLARKVLLSDMGLSLDDEPMELDSTLGEELLRPTAIYSPVTTALSSAGLVKAFAHITGGGLPENVARVVPAGLQGVIDSSSWERPAIFDLIASLGHVPSSEMYKAFNMGIGMVVVVGPGDANSCLDLIRTRGSRAFEIGRVGTAKDQGGAVRIL